MVSKPRPNNNTHNNMVSNIQNIIDQIARRRTLAGVTRHHKYDVDIAHALAVMEALGQRRISKFRIDDDNRWAYTQLIRWLYAMPSMEAADPEAAEQKKFVKTPGRLASGIFISGSTGTGKSWAMEMLNIFADIDSPQVTLGEDTKTLHWGCFRAEDIWEECAGSDAGMAKYKTAPILCIQDLGSEPIGEAVRMGTRREPLRQILEARGDRNDLITLITSNFGICSPELERRYTDRVVSRLKGMCNFIPLTGIDRRTL